MVKCEGCGEEFWSLFEHVDHGSAVTCLRRQLAKAQANESAALYLVEQLEQERRERGLDGLPEVGATLPPA